MAIHRQTPICRTCGEPHKAIHKKVNKAFQFIGDTFIRWEHDCKMKDSNKEIGKLIMSQVFKDPVESFRTRVIEELEGMKITGLGKYYNDVSALENMNNVNSILKIAIERIKNLK